MQICRNSGRDCPGRPKSMGDSNCPPAKKRNTLRSVSLFLGSGRRWDHSPVSFDMLEQSELPCARFCLSAKTLTRSESAAVQKAGRAVSSCVS